MLTNALVCDEDLTGLPGLPGMLMNTIFNSRHMPFSAVSSSSRDSRAKLWGSSREAQATLTMSSCQSEVEAVSTSRRN